MNNLAIRNLEVLQALVAGPTTGRDLRYLGFKKNKEIDYDSFVPITYKQRSGQVLDGQNVINSSGPNAADKRPEHTSHQYFYKKMRTLIKQGYVAAKKYYWLDDSGYHHEMIYALTDVGKQNVCNIMNITDKQIRYALPQPHHICHELLVTNVIRKIYEESGRNLYKIADFKTENAIKQTYMEDWKKIPKDTVFEDFNLILVGTKKRYRLRFEIACKKDNYAYWTRKLKSFDLSIHLLIYRDELLSEMKEIVKSINWGHVARLALVKDFLAGGIAHTKWWRWPGENVATITEDLQQGRFGIPHEDIFDHVQCSF